MSKIIIKYSFLIMLGAAFFSCKKNTDANVPYDVYGITPTQGQLKINFTSTYFSNPSVILKINGVAVSSLITARTPFPGGGYNTNGSNFALYLGIPQGMDTVSIIRPKVGTSDDSIVLYKTIINIPDNKPYTLHITDTLVNSTTNNTKSLLVANEISNLDSGFCKLRFVNLIPNLPAVDLYLNGVLMKSNIGYLQATDTFRVALGLNQPGVPVGATSAPTPTWVIRAAGSAPTSTIIATYANANTLQNQLVLTGFFMGYSGLTGTRLPYLSFTLDKNQ